MEHSIRNVQSTKNRSLLLKLYQQLDEFKDTRQEAKIQDSINQIIAQNYLEYVNR
jgi:hypothetical protein